MKIVDHETTIWNDVGHDDDHDQNVLVSADITFSRGTPGSLSDAPGYLIENLTAIDSTTRQEVKLTSSQAESLRNELTSAYASQL